MNFQLREGDRVLVRGQARHGTIVKLGRCGWPKCGNGADCVQVAHDHESTTRNHHRRDVYLEP